MYGLVGKNEGVINLYRKSPILLENDNQRRVMLLEVLASYAPDWVSIDKLGNALQNATPKEVAAHIYDGLAYGNWLWVLNRSLFEK